MRYILVFFALAFFNQKSIAQIPAGVKAQYLFTNNTLDSSGNNFHGTGSSLVATNDRFNRPNHAYYFNGSSSWLSTIYQPTNINALTVSFWVKSDLTTTGLNVQRNMYDFRGAQSDPSFLFCFYEGNGNLTYGLQGGFYNMNAYTPAGKMDTSWTHYVVMWTGVTGDSIVPSQFKLYKNAVLQSSYPFYYNVFSYLTAPYSTPTNLSIGRFAANMDFFRGYMDDFHFYERTLTVKEILELYNWSPTPNSIAGYAKAEVKLSNLGAGQFLISTPYELDGYKFHLRNAQGSLVPMQLYRQSSHQARISLDPLATGLYLLTVTDSKGMQQTVKLAVE